MDVLTLIGLLVVVYFAAYFVLLPFVDCDLTLLFADIFGKKLDKYKGKVVWITGASSGIGEFLAVELAKHGAKLVLTARSVLNLERVKGRCLDAGSKVDDLLVLPADITAVDKHQELFARVVTHFGKLDILVNNAGRSQRAIWENIELEVDKDMFDLNVFSVVSLSRIAVKYFLKVGQGQIALTSSLAGVIGVPYSGSYTAAKHALNGYFKSLRTEKLGKNLTVTIICPGPVFSNFLNHCFTEVSGQVLGQDVAPSDRRMTTERCAYLTAVAIINKVEEAWVALFPILPVVYIHTYFPTITKWMSHLVGSKEMMKLRDSRSLIKIQE